MRKKTGGPIAISKNRGPKYDRKLRATMKRAILREPTNLIGLTCTLCGRTDGRHIDMCPYDPVAPLREATADKIVKVRVSGMFTAILDCLLAIEPRTRPTFDDLILTSDGFLLGQIAGDLGFNDFLGSQSDLVRNVQGLASVAELTHDETVYLIGLVDNLKRR